MLATLALGVGLLVYATLRSPLFAWLPERWPWTGTVSASWLRAHTEQLPSLTHSFALSLCLGMAVGQELRYRLRACAFWGVLAVACEFAQSDLVHHLAVPVSMNGTFDWFDVAASLLGASAAAAMFLSLSGDLHE